MPIFVMIPFPVPIFEEKLAVHHQQYKAVKGYIKPVMISNAAMSC